jgi:hypothetical protein
MQRYYSNIYWHFTGSPENIDWSKVKKPQDILKFGHPKKEEQSVEIMFKIIESQKLLATCYEKVAENFQTEKFCCVTDIPLKDLLTHGKYYGNVAIGFKAKAIHDNFIPVLYISENNLPFIKKIFHDAGLVDMAYKELLYDDPQGIRNFYSLMSRAKKEKIEIDISKMSGFLSNFIKITKFDIKDGVSFYREREWRHIGDFNFKLEDIEAVVVPQKLIGDVKEKLSAINELKEISIIAWEFLRLA